MHNPYEAPNATDASANIAKTKKKLSVSWLIFFCLSSGLIGGLLTYAYLSFFGVGVTIKKNLENARLKEAQHKDELDKATGP